LPGFLRQSGSFLSGGHGDRPVPEIERCPGLRDERLRKQTQLAPRAQSGDGNDEPARRQMVVPNGTGSGTEQQYCSWVITALRWQMCQPFKDMGALLHRRGERENSEH